MPNVNKVIYGNETLVDMTDATADASKIARGYTAYLRDGSKATGTLDTMDAESFLHNFATVEDTNTASQSYETGDYLVLNKLLYRVTSPIASGGNITIGTNVTQTNVGYELSNLLIAYYDATDESIVFRSHEVASYDPTDESITINI